MRISGEAVRPGHIVCFVVRIVDGVSQYLLLRRCGPSLKGNWQMVSGGIEHNEKAWEAALREVKEETGLSPDAFYLVDFVETFYEVASDKVVFGTVFLAMTGLSQNVVISDEHDQYIWLSAEEALPYLQFTTQQKAVLHIEENYIKKEPFDYFQIMIPAAYQVT